MICNLELEKALESIAKEHLHIATLKLRNSDCLDFHEVSVSRIEQALLAAYTLGLEAGMEHDNTTDHR